MDININTFLDKFNSEYEYLHNLDGECAGYREAVNAFDEFAEHHASFVGEFVRHRGDMISSDREAATFMFTLSSMM